MRICFVLDSWPGDAPEGGVEKATHALCVGLQRAGHEVVLVAGGHGAKDSWGCVPTLRVPTSGRHMLVGGARQWSAAVVRALAELKPDVAQGQGLGFAGAAVVAWQGGVRLVCAHGNTLMDLRHAHPSPVGWAVRAPLVRAYSVRAIERANAVVNVTSDWRVNCPVRPRVMTYIPNAVDDVFFGAEASPEAGTVAYFGGSRRIKGSDLLLSAWQHVHRELPEARLDLYGFSAAGRAQLPANCVAHAALTSSDAIAGAMNHAGVVVLPSRYEVSPVVAAEAMTVGVPLVATDVGGVRAMADGVAALCTIDPREIAAQIIAALRSPHAWAERVAEGRRRSAAFSIDAVVARYVELYESLVGGANPAGSSAR